MKAIRVLKIVLKDTIMSRERAYLEEAIKELEDLKERILHLESIETDMIMEEIRSCDNCKYQTIAEYSCKSCSKYYKDEWENKQ